MKEELNKTKLSDAGLYDIYYDNENHEWWIDYLAYDYRIGRVVHRRAKQHLNSGKKTYNVYINKKGYQLAKVLYAWFIGPVKQDCVVTHEDGNPLNDSLSNLILETKSQRKARLKLEASGDILLNDKITKIRKAYLTTYLGKEDILI